MEWILASQSPRRKELFSALVPNFDIMPAVGEERAEAGLSPEALVKTLAYQKAAEIKNTPLADGKAVLGSDTVVALDGEVLGKPKDEAEAFRMLSALSGRTHEVFTGVCILYEKDGKRVEIVEAARTEVEFETLTDDFIRAYIAGGSPMDKAGAYGIQDGGLVKSIRGSYSNVVGLPVELLKTILGEM